MGRPRKTGTTEREEKHLDRIRLASRARMRAYAAMREAHPEEYDALCEKEATALGITPATVARRTKREALLAQLAELDKEDGRTARRRSRQTVVSAANTRPKGRSPRGR